MNLQEKYKKQVIPAMKEKFGYKNDFAVPELKKVIINTGIGKFKDDPKAVEEIENALTLIGGQKPVFSLAKKSIANFKIRQGMKVGLKTTLRGKRMYDFLERFIGFSLPRGKDFRGIAAKAIDQRGNLTVGIKEHIIFPEISSEEVRIIFGFEVCVSTNAKSREEGDALFRLLGFPLKKGD